MSRSTGKYVSTGPRPGSASVRRGGTAIGVIVHHFPSGYCDRLPRDYLDVRIRPALTSLNLNGCADGGAGAGSGAGTMAAGTASSAGQRNGEVTFSSAGGRVRPMTVNRAVKLPASR